MNCVNITANLTRRGRKRELSNFWKGGIAHTSGGYIGVLVESNPFRDKRGYVMQHRLVIEESIGRYLRKDEVVHHINGIKDDNRLENLLLMTRKEHHLMHHVGSKRKASTKKLLSERAKHRFKDKRNHPFYKDINVEEMVKLRENGMLVKEICEKFNICKKTFYKKIKETK